MSDANIDRDRQYQILFELMDEIKLMDRRRTPAENSTEILLKVYKLIGNNDPYREAKAKSNALALAFYPELKNYLEKSENRLYEALKISVAGNVIDLGINKNFDLEGALKHSLGEGFAKDDFGVFNKRLAEADEVIIIGDNAGEIVFDRLLVEELSRLGKVITYIVKSGPVLNDATMEDVIEVGMDKIARVVTTGANYLGFPLPGVSGEARRLLERSAVVIAKGHANFETLEHEELARGRIFFLLKIKCECVARVIGANFGDVVFFTR